MIAFINQLFCKHQWRVLRKYERLHDEASMLPGSEYFRGGSGKIMYEKYCTKCRKRGIETHHIFT